MPVVLLHREAEDDVDPDSEVEEEVDLESPAIDRGISCLPPDLALSRSRPRPSALDGEAEEDVDLDKDVVGRDLDASRVLLGVLVEFDGRRPCLTLVLRGILWTCG